MFDEIQFAIFFKIQEQRSITFSTFFIIFGYENRLEIRIKNTYVFAFQICSKLLSVLLEHQA